MPSPRRLIVLGASTGIGAAVVTEAQNQGWVVGATGRRASLLKGDHNRSFDLTAPDAIDQIDALISEMGGVDLILFNAGFGHRTPTLDHELVNQTIQLNIVAFTQVAHYALRHQIDFAAVASIAGLMPFARTNAYPATKAYMLNYMASLRRQLRQDKSKQLWQTILPGFVDTAMGQASRFWRASPETAASCILAAIGKRREITYVTPRWRLIAILLRLLQLCN